MSDTKKITLNDVFNFILRASKEERKAISQTLSVCREDDIREAKFEFKVGDRVKFRVSKRGYAPRVVRGVITKKNVKTFHVRPTNGYFGEPREWKVTASLVEKDDTPVEAEA